MADTPTPPSAEGNSPPKTIVLFETPIGWLPRDHHYVQQTWSLKMRCATFELSKVQTRDEVDAELAEFCKRLAEEEEPRR